MPPKWRRLLDRSSKNAAHNSSSFGDVIVLQSSCRTFFTKGILELLWVCSPGFLDLIEFGCTLLGGWKRFDYSLIREVPEEQELWHLVLHPGSLQWEILIGLGVRKDCSIARSLSN